jgi:hypothetical protein
MNRGVVTLLLASMLSTGFAAPMPPVPTTSDSTLNSAFQFIWQRLERLQDTLTGISTVINGGLGSVCGNSLITGTEECDGSTLPGGTCVSCRPDCTCVRHAVCGNGVFEPQLGELCEPPAVVGSAGCTALQLCNACVQCVNQPAPICNDTITNAPELCDPPFETSSCGGGQVCAANCLSCSTCGNGTLDSGEECDPGDRYATTTDGVPAPVDGNCAGGCLPTCTCPPAACSNGIWDTLRGERCDPTAGDTNPCPGTVTDPITGAVATRCTNACVCLPQCQNGVLETGTGSTSIDENCEFPQTGVDFDRAIQLSRNACSTTNNGCATARDQGGNRNGVGTSWDYLGATAFTAMVKFRLPSLPSVQHRLIWDGAGNDTTPGWLAEISVGNQIAAAFDATTAAGGLTTMVGTTVLVPNTNYTAFLRKNVDGTSVSLWLSNPATGVVVQEAAATITSLTNGSTQLLSLGGSNLSSGALEGTLDEVAIWDRELTAGNMNALVNAEVATTSANLSLLLDFSEAIGATTVTSKAGIAGVVFTLCDGTDSVGGGSECSSAAACTVNCTGTIALVTSPWSTAPPTTACAEPCGCISPQVCNPSSCRCGDVAASGTRTFFVAATGANANYPCTSSSLPCATVNYVLDKTRAQPGDKVRLLDNSDSTPQANINLVCDTGTIEGGCTNSTGTNALCGTAAAPITIEAVNERQAAFIGDGSTNPIRIQGCQWYTLIGLAARNNNNVNSKKSTEHTIYLNYVKNIILDGLLGDKSNQCSNCHVYSVENSTDVTITESECSRNNRHCFRRSKTRRVTIQRAYANNGNVSTSPDPACTTGGTPQPGGPDHGQYTNYPANESIDLNNLAEGRQGWGNQDNGGPGLGGIRGTSDNVNYGNIYAGTYACIKNYARPSDCRGNAFNTIANFVCVQPQISFGIQDAITQGSVYDRLTLWKSLAASLFIVRDPATGTCASPSDPAQLACGALTTGNPSFSLTNSVITNGSGTDVQVDACQAAAVRNGTITNTRADTYGGIASGCTPGGGDDDLDCTNARSGAGEIPTNVGDTGAGKCLTVVRCSVNGDCGTTGGTCAGGICDTGADARCLYSAAGARLTGATNNMWWQTGDATPGGTALTTTALCNATPPAGLTRGCRGGFKFCRATRAGWNDGTLTSGTMCRNFAARWLNQLPEDTGCTAAQVACP